MKSKTIINAFLSTVICILYLCATVGFDVHHNNHDHHYYVVSLLAGISCENIHPEDECECCHCMHSHENEEENHDCTDEIHQITITGTDFHCHFDFTPLSFDIPGQQEELGCLSYTDCIFSDYDDPIPPDDILEINCILRV